jgi:NADH-quinone oxidoreductase subunit H
MPEFNLWYTIISIVVVLGVLQGTCAFLIYLERKIAAYVQDRVGPNRVGPAGLLQSVADGLKFLLKEDIIPDRVDRPLYLLAPGLAVGTALLAFAVVPFGAPTDLGSDAYPWAIAPRVDIGILFIFAVTSLAVYGIILGGWAGNNKYSFIGGLRSSAQVISYEIPLGLSVLGVILLSGSLNLERVIERQSQGWAQPWFIFIQPVAFLLFMLSSFAECNRLPFDLPEAEQELVGGYHTEYSAMKFAMFFLGEYTSMITSSFLMVILFLGGWHFPWIAEAGSPAVLKFIVLFLKVWFFIFFYMLVRWTLPRFRFDQLMSLAWKVLIPLALVNLVCVMVVRQLDWNLWVLLPVSLALGVAGAWLSAQPGSSDGHERMTPHGQSSHVVAD